MLVLGASALAAARLARKPDDAAAIIVVKRPLAPCHILSRHPDRHGELRPVGPTDDHVSVFDFHSERLVNKLRPHARSPNAATTESSEPPTRSGPDLYPNRTKAEHAQISALSQLIWIKPAEIRWGIAV